MTSRVLAMFVLALRALAVQSTLTSCYGITERRLTTARRRP